MTEEWRPIAGFEGLYEVSNLGNVKSLRRDRLLKQHPDGWGYLQVTLCNGFRKTMKVHRLVATAFCENPNHYGYINHKDINNQNNKSENLEWCTALYNNHYSDIYRGCRKRVAQIKDGEVIKVWNSEIEACKELGIRPQYISAAVKGIRKTVAGYVWTYA